MKSKTVLLAIAATCVAFGAGARKSAPKTGMNEIIYVQTNDFHAGKNAVLAYRHTGNGALKQLSGSPFLTGGTGVGNPKQELGPADSDNEMWMTDDKKFLLVVNSGSNNITVFRVKNDGSLGAVAGSPFPSGGETPVSVCMKAGYVYVVNKSQNPVNPTTSKPNYCSFRLGDDGRLAPVAGGKVETGMGTSPSQTLVSADGRVAFGCDFLGFMQKPPVGTLRSFQVSNGVLSPVGEPQVIPEKGGALGLWQHPKADVLYVGFPVAGMLGIYSFSSRTGELKYESAVMAGKAACWIRSNKSGSHLYTLNSGENTISAYNASQPTALKSLGKLTLRQSGPMYEDMGMEFTTSQPFAFELSADEHYMYVLNQHTNKDFSVGNYNYLHVVKIGEDGMLTQPSEPLQLPISNMLRPKGVIVYKMN